MFYTIYKITNKIDGKIYIGKHQTKDLNDGYMGSGKYLKHSIEKYGIENFEKEILYQFDSEEKMNAKEAELVTEEFVKQDTNYNLCPGGNGGFGYINSSGLRTKGHTPEMYEKVSKSLKGRTNPDARERYKRLHKEGKLHAPPPRYGPLSEEHKNNISKSRSGNGCEGTIWITNGSENKKIKTHCGIPPGWRKGRITQPPNLLTKLNKCKSCETNESYEFWWNAYLQSGLSVSQFVRDIYPFNRASFYNMKKRMLQDQKAL